MTIAINKYPARVPIPNLLPLIITMRLDGANNPTVTKGGSFLAGPTGAPAAVHTATGRYTFTLKTQPGANIRGQGPFPSNANSAPYTGPGGIIQPTFSSGSLNADGAGHMLDAVLVTSAQDLIGTGVFEVDLIIPGGDTPTDPVAYATTPTHLDLVVWLFDTNVEF